MIKLRLQRRGRKKRPYYHIVVADSRSPRDGRIIEKLGRFDNVSERKELTYDEERVIHWLKIGAQPSNTVRNILQKEGVLYKMHLMRWGKSDEEIEAALNEWKTEREAKDGEKVISRKVQQKEQLKSEEKEFKKQVEEKAAAAAKELEKKKAEEAKAKEEAEAKAAAEKKEAAQEAAEETKAKAEPKKEKPAETKSEEDKAEKPEEAETKEEVKAEKAPSEDVKQEPKVEAKEEVKEEPKAEAKKEEKKEPKAEEKKDEAAPSALSTDMNANEAIEHIKNTPLEELKDFVPEGEDRVTVQRAWEAKQEE